MGMKKDVFSKCYDCKEELTNREREWYNKHVTFCCSGLDCCCGGYPIEPPYCFKCMGMKEVFVISLGVGDKPRRTLFWTNKNKFEEIVNIRKAKHFTSLELAIDFMKDHKLSVYAFVLSKVIEEAK